MKKFILFNSLTPSLLVLLITISSTHQSSAQSNLRQAREAAAMEAEMSDVKTSISRKSAANQATSANDAQAQKSILRFTGTPRSDLPAFNFTAITTESPCNRNCEFHWLINQGTKVISGNSKITEVSSLKPNTDYKVEWIKPDAKNPRLIRVLKLFK